MSARIIVLSEEKLAALLGADIEQPAASPPPPGWSSPEGYATHARVAVKTVRAWCALAPPEAAWKIGRLWRIDAAAFDRWLRAGGPQVVAAALGRAQAHAP